MSFWKIRFKKNLCVIILLQCLPPWIRIHMDIFGILDPDPHENLCGSETLQKTGNFPTWVLKHESENPSRKLVKMARYLLDSEMRIKLWNNDGQRYTKLRQNQNIIFLIIIPTVCIYSSIYRKIWNFFQGKNKKQLFKFTTIFIYFLPQG